MWYKILREWLSCGRSVSFDMTSLIWYDTTAAVLSYLTFALGKHQDVQDKVRQEVRAVLNNHGNLDYETVTRKMKYVGQVINETMRIWPPGLTFDATRHLRLADLANALAYRRRLGSKAKAGVRLRVALGHSWVEGAQERERVAQLPASSSALAMLGRIFPVASMVCCNRSCT
ncbi:hypothetical protein HPB47_022757 [Ixodes persulcatus]|uniref:Uncharacterized protein n=1 Tax=Ixodes persulcatus TaxID=34615 RepID=A0AC60Q9N0_IXOPE|nr:hypothetical protein HPB47_022757 [Ixodes persulcatus]